MEENMLFAMLSVPIFLVVAMKLFMQNKHKNLPPSPPALPIIGHLHLLKKPLHTTLHNLSQKYGPIFTLRLGSRLALVVSSASAVEECLRNDVIFANRPRYSVAKYTDYNQTTLPTVDHGDLWKNLRRIWALEIFSTQRINECKDIIKEEANWLLRKLHKISGHSFAKVEIKPLIFCQLTNVIFRLLAGKRYSDDEDETKNEEVRKFEEIVKEYLELSELINLGDLIPILKWFDFGNIRKFKKFGKKMDLFGQQIIDEHRIYKNTNTVVNHLLGMQEMQPPLYSDEIIKGLILTIVIGASETLSIALEWIMVNLLNNPTILEKAKEEIDSKIGEGRLMEISDLPELSYLQNIIYESYRLTPAFPFLVPRSSAKESTIGGYHIPANTMLFVNARTIHRDPTLWDEPTKFKPERFENVNASKMVKFLPFGYGRRACPGEKLADIAINFTVGLLIQCFEWEKIDEKEIDMHGNNGVLASKVEPLKVMCRVRPILHKAF